MQYLTRNYLLENLIKSFSKQTEIKQIYLFGKDVLSGVDKYSDVDIVLCSNDLTKTQLNYKKIISEISPIWESHLLVSKNNELGETFVLKDCSPYQKIDLTIVKSISTFERSGFGPFVKVVERDTVIENSKDFLTIIEYNFLTNQLNDVLFAIPRFTKTLFRKDFDMYRRWKYVSNILMSLYYEYYNKWLSNNSFKKLSAKDYQVLYGKLSAGDIDYLTQVYPKTGDLSVHRSYYFCIKKILEMLKIKSDYFNIKINEKFVIYMLDFLTIELKKFDKSFNHRNSSQLAAG